MPPHISVELEVHAILQVVSAAEVKPVKAWVQSGERQYAHSTCKPIIQEDLGRKERKCVYIQQFSPLVAAYVPSPYWALQAAVHVAPVTVSIERMATDGHVPLVKHQVSNSLMLNIGRTEKLASRCS